MPATICPESYPIDAEIPLEQPDQLSRASCVHLGPAVPHMSGPYVYSAAGCEIHVATPQQAPELWVEYLTGALTSYRRFGVESVLEYDSVVSGESTKWFFAAVGAGGAILGGMRVQGPYLHADQAHALAEWAGRPGTDQLRREIEDRIPQGVIEMKTGWVGAQVPRKRELTAALARVFLHAIRLTDVRYALGTVATHAVPKWSTTGGEISSEVNPVAYPDPRYQTVPMWWDGYKPLEAPLAAVMDSEHRRLRQSVTSATGAESIRAA